MSPVTNIDTEEDRLAALEEMGIEEKALIYGEAGDKLSISTDDTAIKDFYARAFQEWALGNVEGTAEEIFDGVRFFWSTNDFVTSRLLWQVEPVSLIRRKAEPSE